MENRGWQCPIRMAIANHHQPLEINLTLQDSDGHRLSCTFETSLPFAPMLPLGALMTFLALALPSLVCTTPLPLSSWKSTYEKVKRGLKVGNGPRREQNSIIPPNEVEIGERN